MLNIEHHVFDKVQLVEYAHFWLAQTFENEYAYLVILMGLLENFQCIFGILKMFLLRLKMTSLNVVFKA